MSLMELEVTVRHGPVKQPTRAIEKTVRAYASSPRRLTDTVRCSIVANDLKGVVRVLEAFFGVNGTKYGREDKYFTQPSGTPLDCNIGQGGNLF